MSPRWFNPSGTFIYSPDIAVYVATERGDSKAAIYDLSPDIERFTLTRRINSESDFQCTINNKHRKYDRVIDRMSRIVVFLKRVNWLQCFAGYVTLAPYATIVPGSVEVGASCTLKRLEHIWWDNSTAEATFMFPGSSPSWALKAMDGGAAASMFRLLTRVAKWPEDQIHIQKIPLKFLKQAAILGKSVEKSIDQQAIGLYYELLDAEGYSATPDPVDIPFGKWKVPTKGFGPWGGHQNGKIPPEAMAPIGSGKYLRPDAAESFQAMVQAARKQGITVTATDAFRSYEAQVQCRIDKGCYGEGGLCACPPGTSNHGWGLAVDFGDSPGERTWLHQHGSEFGWIFDVAGEPWHGEFKGSGSGQFTGKNFAGNLDMNGQTPFNVLYYTPSYNPESDLFSGDRAWINDAPVLGDIQALTGASLRNFQSAPNGDFVAWFPDKWGIYGKTPTMKVRDIEIIDLKLSISDDSLATHVGIFGDVEHRAESLGMPDGISTEDKLATYGIVTIEQQRVMKLMLGLDPNKQYAYLSPEWVMKRFGIRPYTEDAEFLADHRWEFMYALHTFMDRWSKQFLTDVSFTFLPEIYPGMRIEIDSDHLEYLLGLYVEQVIHSGDRAGGFQTSITVSSPTRWDESSRRWVMMPMEREPIEIPEDEKEEILDWSQLSPGTRQLLAKERSLR